MLWTVCVRSSIPERSVIDEKNGSRRRVLLVCANADIVKKPEFSDDDCIMRFFGER